MSAICGILRLDGAPVDRAALDRMQMVHTPLGRDGGETLAHDAIGFGHRLLRVNAEDRFDAQPIHDRRAGLTIVADMRLDNRDVLIDVLGLDAAASGNWPDSAFLAPAYTRWGEACVEHLVGDFAFAIWDIAERVLVLARDHMGQRDLYHHQREDMFAFATDPAALQAMAGLNRAMPEARIGQILTRDPTGSRTDTEVEGVSRLPKASMMTVRIDRAPVTRCYWTPTAAPEHLHRGEAYYLKAYRDVLGEAVACRVRRVDGRPALFMSGAFDSGAIAVLAGPIAAAKGETLMTLTSALPEGESRPAMHDPRSAVEAFRHFPWIDIRYHVEGKRGALDRLDVQFAEFGLAGTLRYLHGKLIDIAAGGRARILMDGYGGDYTLHPRPKHLLGDILRRGHIRRFLREFRARRHATGASVKQIIARDVMMAFIPLRARRWREAARRGFRKPWTSFAINERFAERLVAEGALSPGNMRIFGQQSRRWRANRDHNLMLAETPQAFRARALRKGMDFTRPFHDKRVVELALALPDSIVFNQGRERYLPRTALADLLPDRLRRSMAANTTFDPDPSAILRGEAQAALAELRELDHDGRISRYIDLAKIEAAITDVDVSSRRHLSRATIALNGLVLGRYLAWSDRRNASDRTDAASFQGNDARS